MLAIDNRAEDGRMGTFVSMVTGLNLSLLCAVNCSGNANLMMEDNNAEIHRASALG